MKRILTAVLLLSSAAMMHAQDGAVNASPAPSAPAAAPAVDAAAAVDASGTWTLTGDVQDNPIAELCTLKQAGNALTGTCDGQNGRYDTTGTVSGSQVIFKHGGTYQGTDLTVTFTGTIAADGTMSGGIDVDPFQVSGTFKAQKGAAPAAGAAS